MYICVCVCVNATYLNQETCIYYVKYNVRTSTVNLRLPCTIGRTGGSIVITLYLHGHMTVIAQHPERLEVGALDVICTFGVLYTQCFTWLGCGQNAMSR